MSQIIENGEAFSMRIGWVGFHCEGMLALESLLKDGMLQCVITLEEESLRKRSGFIDYEELVEPWKTPLYKIHNINDPESVSLLKELSLDVVFVIGWSQVVGKDALSTARIGMIGAHASVLPHNRGSAPINWAIINGEKETGNTLIWLAEGVDSGDIIDHVTFPVTVYDTCSTLYQRVAESNATMIRRVLPKILRGEKVGRAQPHTNEPALPRRRPQDGLIHWEKDHESIYDFVRALTKPYPGAFSMLDNTQWTIWSCAMLPGENDVRWKPGHVVGPVFSPIEDACGQVVKCGKGAIILLELEDTNGNVLKGRELSNQQWTEKVWAHERWPHE